MFIPTDIYNEILKSLPILCVDVLIVHQGKCLLLLRNNEPAKGEYWFPGGRIHKNETIEDAALRKAKEETNLDCLFERIISTEESIFEKNENMLTDIHTVNVCCLLSVSDLKDLRTDQLHTGFNWVDRLDSTFHNAVKNPLYHLGFNFKY